MVIHETFLWHLVCSYFSCPWPFCPYHVARCFGVYFRGSGARTNARAGVLSSHTRTNCNSVHHTLLINLFSWRGRLCIFIFVEDVCFSERDNVVYWKTKRKIKDDLQEDVCFSALLSRQNLLKFTREQSWNRLLPCELFNSAIKISIFSTNDKHFNFELTQFWTNTDVGIQINEVKSFSRTKRDIFGGTKNRESL